ncbi:TlpA family protein disulfide reductase [Natronobacterium gregoryi]|uniref:Thioredoxin n=2 Tax=Natronobacterium gregoryi TaxID=44930 RepID=L9XMU5_NATGS|nr:hypothetical protein [Natronobacterium gregoryi]ELY63045.1 hypothetical protein C490_16521 [Natronobacterium gregoryi SP2]PLK20124.1 hypothetical protein CYV19_11275 [Natronobacterium gregoryi SP2]SFJ32656.1 hypothetical protein SAMN05443661_12223 [Natronobacterium gregoryi]
MTRELCNPQNDELAVVENAVGDVSIHAISPESDVDLVADYWADSPAEFSALVDPDATVMEYDSVRSYPSLVLVDSSDTVRWQPGDEREILAIGPVPDDVILEWLDQHR